MGKQKNGTAKVTDLAVLASNIGLVENSDDGRNAFLAWWANDQAACRKALFSRVAARRVAASAAKAAGAGTGSPSAYPNGWLRAAGVRRSKGADR